MKRFNELGARPSDLPSLGFTLEYDPMDFTRRRLEALDNYTMKESTMNCIKYLLFLLNLLISVSKQFQKDIYAFLSSLFLFHKYNMIFA